MYQNPQKSAFQLNAYSNVSLFIYVRYAPSPVIQCFYQTFLAHRLNIYNPYIPPTSARATGTFLIPQYVAPIFQVLRPSSGCASDSPADLLFVFAISLTSQPLLPASLTTHPKC